MNEQKQKVGDICLTRGFVSCIAQLHIIIVEDRVKAMFLLLHNTKENRGVEV